MKIERHSNTLRAAVRAAALSIAGLGALMGGVLSSTPAMAAASFATKEVNFDIPAQSLESALLQLSKQADVQVMIGATAIAGQKTEGVRGRLSVSEALSRLLSNTGLTFETVGNTVTVRAVAAAETNRTVFPLTAGVVLASAQAEPGGAETVERESNGVDSKNEATLAEVIVTGSYIRGAAPAGADIRVIDRAAIDRSGRSTVQDLMQTLPENFSGGVNESSSLAGRTSGSSVDYNYGSSLNLRGLGSDSTLVLLNGHRLAPAGIGDFVDVSTIPLSAIDRIDILADGASATYGSDAMAGVVNIVTRKDFQGAQTSARFGTVTDGSLSEIQASQLFGFQWNSGSAFLTYEFQDRDNLAASDRGYAANADLREFGGHDYRVTASSPGNITYPSLIAGAIPSGQDGTTLTAGEILPDSVNLQNQRLRTDLLPEQKRHSIVLSGTQNLNSRADLHFDALFAQRDSMASISAATQSLSVPASNAFRQMNGLLSGDSEPIELDYSFINDVGPQVRDGTARAYSLTAGVALEVSGTWRVDSYASLGDSRDKSRLTGSPDIRAGGALEVALASSDPATAFNPFGDGGDTSPEVLADIFAPSNVHYRSRFWSLNTIADGELVSLPAGPIKLAIGAEYRSERFDTAFVSLYSSGAETASTPNGQRLVRAAFTELHVPLFSEENRLSGIRRMDLSLSARLDDYSDFGSSTNPKAGLTWSPTNGLTLRGTYGTSFKAPRINDLYTISQGLAADLPAFLGGPDLNNDGVTTLLLVDGGNRGLQPETGRTWTAGFEFQPEAVPALTIQARYFKTHFEDRISRLATLVVPFLNPEPYLGLVYFVGPGQAQVDNLIDSLASFSGTPPTPGSVEAIVDLRLNNISVVDVNGIDADLSYRFTTQYGAFDVSTSASYILNFDEKFAPALPAVETVDTIAHPLAFRARVGLGWSYNSYYASTFVNYQGSYTNTEVLPNDRVDALTTVDLLLGYQHLSSAGEPAWLDDTKLTLTVTNLFDKDPPFTDSPFAGFDGANGTPLGRFAAVELTKSW